MCSGCELKNREQLEFASEILDNVWSEHGDDVRGWLRTYLVDAIMEYEDRHVHIPLPTVWGAMKFRYECNGRIGQAIRTGFEVLGEKMWRAMVPQQRD